MTTLPRRLLPDTADVGDDGWLTVGGCSVRDLAAEFGTPFMMVRALAKRWPARPCR